MKIHKQPLSISTIEKRFGFESWMAGLFFTTYDLCFVLASVIISTCFAKTSVPKIVGGSMLLFRNSG